MATIDRVTPENAVLRVRAGCKEIRLDLEGRAITSSEHPPDK